MQTVLMAKRVVVDVFVQWRTGQIRRRHRRGPDRVGFTHQTRLERPRRSHVGATSAH